MAAEPSPITFPDDGLTHVRVIAKGPAGWMTQVEVNGLGVPVYAIEYKASVHGRPEVTLTFPAVLDLEVALATGQVKIRQSRWPWFREAIQGVGRAVEYRIHGLRITRG